MLTLVANGAQVKVDSKSKLNYIGVICAQKNWLLHTQFHFVRLRTSLLLFLLAQKNWLLHTQFF
jgi:hypothetical protein